MRQGFIMLLLSVCLTATVQAQTITRFTLSGPEGEYLTGGQTFTRTPTDGVFSIERNFGGQNGISLFYHNADYSDFWQVDFCGPNQAQLQTGEYYDATRLPFVGQPGAYPGLQIVGNYRSCTETAGRFEIKRLSYGPSGDVLEFWVMFSMVCNNPPYVLGEILYGVNLSTPAKAPTWGQLKTMYR